MFIGGYIKMTNRIPIALVIGTFTAIGLAILEATVPHVLLRGGITISYENRCRQRQVG
jgi:hypothetical protein